MVSGSRQRNSNTRLIHCTRSRIQTIVGTSSTSTTTHVMTASSSVISIAGSSGGGPVYDAICFQAVSDHVPSRFPSRENRTIASSGRRKNSPNIVKTR